MIYDVILRFLVTYDIILRFMIYDVILRFLITNDIVLRFSMIFDVIMSLFFYQMTSLRPEWVISYIKHSNFVYQSFIFQKPIQFALWASDWKISRFFGPARSLPLSRGWLSSFDGCEDQGNWAATRNGFKFYHRFYTRQSEGPRGRYSGIIMIFSYLMTRALTVQNMRSFFF